MRSLRAQDGTRMPEPARLLAGIRHLVRRFSVSERADVACCGMTVAQAATLQALQAEPGMRLAELGRRLGIAPSTLTRNLGRLEEAALVARCGDAADARTSRARLTAAGERAAAELEQQAVSFAADVLERIPAERRARLLESLDDLLGALRGATEDCCPGAFEHLVRDFPQARSCGTRRRHGSKRGAGNCG